MPTRIAMPSSTSRIHSSLLILIRDALDRQDLTFDMRTLWMSLSESAEMILCRGTDVPAIVGGGVADVGITGYDMAVEWMLGNDVELEMRSLPARTSFVTFAGVSDREVTHIYTEYWNITKAWQAFSGTHADADLIRLHGSSEGVIHSDPHSAGVLLVTSGITAEANGLDITIPLLQTDSVVLRRKGADSRIGHINPDDLPLLDMPAFALK